MPEGTTTVSLWDVRSILEDDTPESVKDGLEKNFDLLDQRFGILIEDLTTIVEVNHGNEQIFEGDSDLEIVREELDDQGWDDDDYQGYETWVAGGERMVAIVGDSGSYRAGTYK